MLDFVDDIMTCSVLVVAEHPSHEFFAAQRCTAWQRADWRRSAGDINIDMMIAYPKRRIFMHVSYCWMWMWMMMMMMMILIRFFGRRDICRDTS